MRHTPGKRPGIWREVHFGVKLRTRFQSWTTSPVKGGSEGFLPRPVDNMQSHQSLTGLPFDPRERERLRLT